MTDRRVPWWLCAAAGPVALYAAVTLYAFCFGPERPGWLGTAVQDTFLIQAVRPGSPAGRAGLEPGDRVLSWDGLPVGQGQLAVRLLHVEISREVRLEMERGTERRTVSMTFGRRGWSYWRDQIGQSELLTVLGGSAYLVLAFVIAFARPRDAVALWGALFLAANFVGATDAVREVSGVGRFGVYARLPVPVGVMLLTVVAMVRGSIASMCLTFLAVFPRRLFTARWAWAAIWAPALPSTLITLYWDWHRVYAPEAFGGYGWTAAAANATTLLYLLVAPVFLVASYRRLADPNERRRVRVVVTGFAVSTASVLSGLSVIAVIQFGTGHLWDLAVAYASSPLFLFLASMLLYPSAAVAMA